MRSTAHFVAVLALLSSIVIANTSADDGTTIYECSDTYATVKSPTGKLSIKRNQRSCGFQANENTVSFIIRTDNLILAADEFITVEARNASEKIRNITGPVDLGYLVLGVLQPKITFHLNSNDSSIMLLEFTQRQDKNTKTSLTVDGNRRDQLSIRSVDTQQYELHFTKSIDDPVHVEILGSSDEFGHRLVTLNEEKILVDVDKNSTNDKQVNIAISPVRAACSGNHLDDKSVSITIPDTQDLKESYECVHVFETKGADHYDVDFANFLDIVDVSDKLSIIDQTQTLVISRPTATKYYTYKPNVSFKGKKLAIVYSSPIFKEPRKIPLKLTVNEAQFGGVVDSYGKLTLPPKGSAARYSLKPPNNDSRTISLQFDKFSGSQIKISDGRNNVVTLPAKSFFPPIIAFKNVGEGINLELNTNYSKPDGTITYKSGNDCSGTIFGNSGTISIKDGGNKTCYWLLGAESTLKITYNDLQDGSLDIYSLDLQDPLFSKSKISQTEVLPPFIIGPAYLKITLNSPESSFIASVSPVVKSQVHTTQASQTNISSIGYPTSYAWSSRADMYTIVADNKSVILAVADRDLRDGEKLFVGLDEVTNLAGLADFEVSSNNLTINVNRTNNTKDFGLHRGYKIVLQEYQSIISADTKKTSLKTPANATNLLLKISAISNTRLLYNITFSDAPTNYEMRVFDSRSVLGRLANEAEKVSGSTTSNMLLVDIKSTKDKTFLPQLTVSYRQVACNKTHDHICDSSTRCVPPEKMCKGVSYCLDGSDLKVPCSSGPAPPPKIIENGVGGITVFILSVLMFSFGIIAALYGPDAFKSLENRYRSGQYTTFSSTE